MNKIPFHHKIIKSIKDLDFITESIHHKIGSVVLYILILILLFSSISGLVKGLFFTNYVSYVLEVVEAPDFPDFYLSKGTFTIDSTKPIIIDGEDFFFVIDTSGETTINDIARYPVGYLLTDSTLIITAGGKDTNYMDLDMFNWYDLNKDEFVQSLTFTAKFGLFLYTVGNIFMALFSYGFRSLILLLIASILRKMLALNDIKSSQVYKMVLYSSTIGIILYELGTILPQLFPSSTISQLFYAFGSVVLFYIPTTTILSKSFRLIKVKEELENPK